ncbi:MAG TPA: CpaD family pilus assembly protein [Sphingomicrobium sp.]|nr:CpaD family pilus assembly protein [Sphingomicrobium sp.]
MRNSIILLCLTAGLSACESTLPDQPTRGVAAVNTPVVERADYTFDLAAPDGVLAATEGARLNAWFRSLDLGYGDSIYVEGPYAYGAREEVANIAGAYGMMVSVGAPVSAGLVQPGTVRVIVARTRASVPNCPNWNRSASQTYDNQQMPNFGCAVNANLAAMVANPQDLVFGREGSGVGDNRTSVKALDSYRKAVPTGTEGLKEISTKGKAQ